jgi:hypothetical protein
MLGRSVGRCGCGFARKSATFTCPHTPIQYHLTSQALTSLTCFLPQAEAERDALRLGVEEKGAALERSAWELGQARQEKEALEAALETRRQANEKLVSDSMRNQVIPPGLSMSNQRKCGDSGWRGELSEG